MTVLRLLCLLFCVVTSKSAEAQYRPASTLPGAVYLCNVPVGQSVQDLRRKIERHLGAIRCLVVQGLVQNGLAATVGYVSNKPVIQVDREVGATETEICHELLHLKLDADGWPRDPPAFPVGMSQDDAHSITRVQLWSELQHRVVDAEAHRLGMTPDALFRSDLQRDVRSGKTIPPMWQVFPQSGAIEHARELATDRTAAIQTAKDLRRHGMADVASAAEGIDAELQGAAITKERSTGTIQLCLKTLWRELPRYSISKQDLARINRTYEGK
jgi:hypothetical protein